LRIPLKHANHYYKAKYMAAKRLFRSTKDKILGGVCGGIAEYFDVDPVIVRLLWILFSLMFGAGILAYIIAWIIIPKKTNKR
jgi:phage shock protein C